jgi:hypothetical protein
MIAFGEPMWSFTSPLVGRTGGPEKVSFVDRKETFSTVSALSRHRRFAK